MSYTLGILIAIYTAPGHSVVITDRAAAAVAQEITRQHKGGAEIVGDRVCFTRDYPPVCYWPVEEVRR